MGANDTLTYKACIITIFIMVCCNARSQDLDFSGQLSGLHVSGISDPYTNINSMRYIPQLKFDMDSTVSPGFRTEASANLYSFLEFFSPDSLNIGYKIKPYRVWLGLSGDQSEIRIGLQKINFGSAVMLRPLMWFDKMDPRDPLQLTDGVYGALFRYYFLNNANIWVWGLIGNERVKGWEQFSTTSWVPEFGARVQVPAGPGELALSGHFRQIDPARPAMEYVKPISDHKIPEMRVGLDGKWDLIVGLWFESSLERADFNSVFPGMENIRFSRKTTLGMDYTFGIGNGLSLVAEQFNYSQADRLLEKGEGLNFTALSVRYPLTMFSSLSAMLYYDWTNSSWYRFVNLQMVYDKWSFFIMGFWNPERFQIYQNLDEPNVFAGKGIQLMLVYNH